MIRLVAVALVALAIGFGLREALPRQATAAPAAPPAALAAAVAPAQEAEATLNAPGLL